MSDNGAANAYPSSFGDRGLTKRELFAAMALQGMLASDMSTDRTKVIKAKWAEAAVGFADALIAGLAVAKDRK